MTAPEACILRRRTDALCLRLPNAGVPHFSPILREVGFGTRDKLRPCRPIYSTFHPLISTTGFATPSSLAR